MLLNLFPLVKTASGYRDTIIKGIVGQELRENFAKSSWKNVK
jgi:hypothetical protein